MVSPMGNFFTLHVITALYEGPAREGTKYASYPRERRSSLIKSRWPNDESSYGSLEGETGATMGNERWTETVADGRIRPDGSLDAQGNGKGDNLAGWGGQEGLGSREISPVSHAMPPRCWCLRRCLAHNSARFYAKMFISALIFTDEKYERAL